MFNSKVLSRSSQALPFAVQMLLMFGGLGFADKSAKAGASGPATETTAPPVADATEDAKPKRAALTINSLDEIDNLPPEEKAVLLAAAGQRAHIGAGTTGIYVRADGQGFTNDKSLAKRAMGGKGRLIAQYTPPRDANVVAAEELTRMLRLKWAVEARIKATEAQAKRKTPLTEQDLITILNQAGVPESYMRPKASKRLYGRVLSFVRAGALPEVKAS